MPYAGYDLGIKKEVSLIYYYGKGRRCSNMGTVVTRKRHFGILSWDYKERGNWGILAHGARSDVKNTK